MKSLCMVLIALSAAAAARADDFLRKLPDAKFSATLTQEKFRNHDAVIILKEQALTVADRELTYRGVDFNGVSMTRTTIMIAKVFNEKAVARFGSFEYEYPERFGDAFRSGFACRARVQKPDGAVVTMPESDVHLIVSEESSDDEPIARKAVFKVPDLSPGDVVQIEYTLSEPLVSTSSGIFYYNDPVPVLFSNVLITLPADDHLTAYSFPPDQVGEPKTAQMSKTFGEGLTYFWSLRNLNALPDEADTYSFEQMSMMTAFVVDEPAGQEKTTGWNHISSWFYDHYVDEGNVSGSRIEELGFDGTQAAVSMRLADSLYTAIRHQLTLKARTSLYPRAGDIDQVFKRKTGDASDLAYIFYKILGRWHADASVVWIRDRRKGPYEQTAPLMQWFSRLGVLVRSGAEEKVFDFDRGAAGRYEMPSYLKGVLIPIVGEKSLEERTLPDPTVPASFVRESHDLTFRGTDALRDSVVYDCNGTPAEELRRSVYDLKGADLRERLRKVASARCLADVDTLIASNVLDNPEVVLACAGPSQIAPAAMNAFQAVRLADEGLRDFREKIFSAVRFNDIVLQDPLTISVTWRLHLPPGYAVRTAPADTALNTVPGLAGLLHTTRSPDGLQVNAELKFTKRVIAADLFPRVIATLDGLLAASGQPIVLAKK